MKALLCQYIRGSEKKVKDGGEVWRRDLSNKGLSHNNLKAVLSA